MHQAGARHCADVNGTFSGPDWAPPEPAQPQPKQPERATAKLYEAAAAHDGQPAETWLRYLMGRYGELD